MDLLGRRSFVLIASTIVVGIVGYTQFGAQGGLGGGGQDENAPILVETSQLFITIRNNAGLSLFDIQVGIVPVGRATIFTTSYGRMDAGQKQDFSLGNFRGRDGTPFNLRVSRPSAVRVTAKDMNNKPYEVEVPWSY